MKKSLIIVVIISIMIGLIITSLALQNYNIEKPLSDEKELVLENSSTEGKNYVLELEDTISTATQP